jgi:predicted amidohydrolase
MKAAVIQTNAAANKTKNIEKAVKMVCRAVESGARFILLPEVFNYRGSLSGEQGLDAAEWMPGPSTQPFIEIARRSKVFILAGSVYERIKASQKVYNTSAVIDPRGEIIARYRKIHLFKARVDNAWLNESRYFQAGSQPIVTNIDKFRTGLSICYDLRFPGLFRRYAQKKADIICVPSAFTKTTGQAHWKVLLQARAIENMCYVLAPNQIGKYDKGVKAYGHSLIVDPWGQILAEASANKEEIIYANLSQENIRRCRRVIPGYAAS